MSEVQKPELGHGELLIKIRAAGVCGTDLLIYAGHRPDIQLPRVMGHELAGEISKLGGGVRGFEVGAHVSIDPVLACGQCYACRCGRRNLCTSIMCLGCQTDGGFQDFVVAKAAEVHKIKHDIPFEHALKDAVKHLAGTEGVNIVIEAVGEARLMNDAVSIVTRGGRIVVLGMDKQLTNLTEFDFVRTELDIRGSVLNNQKFPQVVKWLEKGQIKPRAMITGVYPIEKIQQAFENINKNPQEALKVIITF